MPSTYRRLIKILSCSLAIVAVLLCSVFVPVNAASWTTLVPAENISSVAYEGNIRKVTYDFGITPIVYYSTPGQSGNFFSSNDFSINGQTYFPFNFGVYPLGIYSEPNQPLSARSSGCIAIDISDFKTEAVISLSSNFHVQIDLGYISEFIGHEDETYTVEVSWSFMQYSATGEYLGFLDGGSSVYGGYLQTADDYFIYDFDLLYESSFNLPSANVEYIVPLAYVTITCTYDVDEIHPTDLRFAYDGFTITAGTDMLLKESLTMEAIEGELGELNDKADEIISGTPEMNQTADELFDQQQDLDEQLENAMVELDKLSDISDDLPADQYTDFYGSVSNITSFLVRAPWTNMTALMQPIMDWSPMLTILLLLVAFINISILFFGR